MATQISYINVYYNYIIPFIHQSDDLASGLMTHGVRRGDRLGIWAPNGLEWILAKYAAARAGLVLVSINNYIKAHV